MAIDHGLGGKESKKSKEKREKRAQKQKAFARKMLTGGNKKEVKFDEAARVEWLTGFRKRKTERRKFGLTKKIEKEKQAIKDARKERRKGEKLAAEELAEAQARARKQAMDSDDEDNELTAAQKVESKKLKEKLEFDDSYTKKLFGANVSIVVNEGICFDD